MELPRTTTTCSAKLAMLNLVLNPMLNLTLNPMLNLMLNLPEEEVVIRRCLSLARRTTAIRQPNL